jgi:SAM-dependent methyltransferase
VRTGARVIAVEPLAEMREQFAAVLPDVELLAASAEELPLPDASAEAITVAAAMHWFDHERALPEFHRVLKPGGALVSVGPGRDLGQPLQRAVQEILGPYLPASEAIAAWRVEVKKSGLFKLAATHEVAYDQLLDADGLAERFGTVSYIAGLPDGVRAEVLERVRELGLAQPETPFPLRYVMGATVLLSLD